MGEAGVDPGCTFCGIVRGDVDAAIVRVSRHTVAFLDRRPLFVGHTLIVPKLHHRTLVDLPEDLIEPLFGEARRVAEAMTRAFGAAGSFVAMNNVVSQSVPHIHVHVVPRKPRDGLKGFFWPRTKYRDGDHMLETAARLRSEIDSGPGPG